MKLDDHPTVLLLREKLSQQSLPVSALTLDAEWLRTLCLDAGADDVGFVELGRPALADQRDDILLIFPWAKSFISFVVRMNREPIRSPARSVANLEFHHAADRLNHITRTIVEAFEAHGRRALNPSVGFPMEMERFPGKIWVISHKPVAVQAGLGQMGIHRNVIHPRFGNFILLGTVVLDTEITAYDSTIAYNPLSGMQALRGSLSDRGHRCRRSFRLLRLLYAQLPRIHGRLHRLGRADRGEPGCNNVPAPRHRC